VIRYSGIRNIFLKGNVSAWQSARAYAQLLELLYQTSCAASSLRDPFGRCLKLDIMPYREWEECLSGLQPWKLKLLDLAYVGKLANQCCFRHLAAASGYRQALG